VPVSFISQYELDEHFYRHGRELGVHTELEYLLLAQAFWVDPKKDTQKQCIRPFDRAVVRYDYQSHEISFLTATGFITTYYILDPAIHGKPTNRIVLRI
jgi:hypothetical protein